MIQSFLVPKEIVERPEWNNAVTRAGEWAAATLGRWMTNKHFTWRVTEEADRETAFDLVMEADGCAAAERFDWFELNNEKLFKSRIREMWGKLVDQSIHNQVERMKREHEEWVKEATVGD
jgi:hypothetical protein